MVGYATAYTMLPVFSLVLDRDVNEDVALLYPELYKELTKVRLCFLSDTEILLSKTERTGSLVVVQDFLYLAYDQRLSRYVPSSSRAPSTDAVRQEEQL